jgi:hypothetical protein
LTPIGDKIAALQRESESRKRIKRRRLDLDQARQEARRRQPVSTFAPAIR